MVYGADVGRRLDEGKGYQMWSEKIASIATEVGFSYRVSSFMEDREKGADIADLSSYNENRVQRT